MSPRTKVLSAVLALFCTALNVSAQFTENKGQIMDVAGNFHPEVRFTCSHGPDHMYFEPGRVVCVFSEAETFDFKPWYGNQRAIDSITATLGRNVQRIDIEFPGSNPDVRIEALEKNPWTTNYYLNQRENLTGVGNFKSIAYREIYPGVDLVFYHRNDGLKYDIVLKEGASLEDVRIVYNGASSVVLQNNEVLITTLYRQLRENLPLAYINGNTDLQADVRYQVNGNEISFLVTDAIPYQQLTIDPVVTWMTFFETATMAGMMDYDHNISDSLGNLFIYGRCDNSANNYPLTNPGGSAYIQSATSNDAYIAKFDPNRALVWSTYFGGNTDLDWSLGTGVMAIKGNTLHIVGDQMSTNGPFLNGGGFYYVASGTRPFWARFNKSTGQLLHLTNISGHSSSHPSIAVSPSGQVGIVLGTYDWGVQAGHIVNRAGAFNQATNGGFTDVFLMLFNSSYTQIWGTFLGGPGTQENPTIGFDASSNIFYSCESQWLSGSTAVNEDLVNPGGGAYYQATNSGEDIMFGKFTSAGALVWNTLYSGNGNDGLDDEMGNGTRVIVSPANELVVIGGTSSTDLPLMTLAGAYNQTCPANVNNGGSYDDFASFILKFSNTGVRQWATYWGENLATAWALLYDGKFTTCNKFIVAARANYTPIPLAGHYNKPSGGQSLLMQFNGSFAAEWSSYIGNNTGVPQITFTPFGNRLYLTTPTYSMTEVTVDPGGGAYYDNVFAGPHYGAYTIWEFNIIPTPEVHDTTICSGNSVTINAGGGIGTIYEWYTTPSGGSPFYTGSSYTTPVLTADVTYYITSSNGSCTSDRVEVNVHVTAGPVVSASATPPVICEGQSTSLDANGALTYTWNQGLGAGETHSVNPSTTTTYTVTGDGGGGCVATASVTVTVNTLSVAPTAISAVSNPICLGGNTDLSVSGGSLGTGATWTWYTGSCGGTPAGTGATINVSPGLNTTYYVLATGTCNTTACASMTLNVTDVDADAGMDQTMCSGEDATLTATGNGSFVWMPGGATTASILVSPAVTTTYTVTVTSGSCTGSDAVTVNVTTQADASITPAGPFCFADPAVTLTAADAGGSWSGTGITNTSAGTFDPAVAGVGTHQIIYTISGSCGDADTISISVVAVSDATITAAGPFCSDDSPVNLQAAQGGGTWSGTGITNASAGTFSPAVSGVGTFSIIYTITGSCGNADTTSITVNASADATVNSAGPFCITEAALNLTAVQPGGTWSGTGITNASNGTFDPSVAGLGSHVITYIIAGLCPDTGSVTVLVNDAYDATITSTGPYCVNAPAVTLTAADGGGTWSGTGITNATSGSFNPTLAGVGTHSIIYVISGACGDADTVSLSVLPSPAATVSGTHETCTGAGDGTAQVTGIGGTSPYTYLWVNGAVTSSLSGLNPGTYSVILTDANGCFVNDTVVIQGSFEPCEVIIPVIYVPNIFSPNGDGDNDVLYVRGQGITELDLRIFNRWGEMVFETTDLNVGWDGTYKGKPLDNAVFVYDLKATFINGESVSRSGNVTIAK